MSEQTSSWFIGSYRNLPDQTITFSGAISGAEVISPSLGGVYLDHNNTNLSLFDLIESAMTSAGATTPYVRFLKNRKIEIGHAGGNFDITWTSTIVRDMLGFTAAKSGASTYIADEVSRWLWSPGRLDDPDDAPLGVIGQVVADHTATVAPNGRMVVTGGPSDQTFNTIGFRYVPAARYQTTKLGEGGEGKAFHDKVMSNGFLFLHMRNITEDDSSSAAATVTMSNQIGPYQINPKGKLLQRWPFKREQRVERDYSVSLDLMEAVEYS